MHKVILSSTFYEEGKKYIPDFFEGIKNATNNNKNKIILNIATDNFQLPSDLINKYKKNIEIKIFNSKKKSTISDMKNFMILKALSFNSDIIVFIDMDDFLSKNSIDYHLESLKVAEISFGNMNFIDNKKSRLNTNLFKNSSIPVRIYNHKPLLKGNFMGFSNTAVNTKFLKKNFVKIPSHLKTSDWWLFTYLLTKKNSKAKKTKYPVACYRTHTNNILNIKKNIDLDDLKEKCNIAEDHFKALPKNKDFDKTLKNIINLKKILSDKPFMYSRIIDNFSKKSNKWMAEVFEIYDLIKNNTQK